MNKTSPGLVEADSNLLVVTPRANVSWRATDAAVLRATLFNAFRTPTVNELFRSFRVGDVITLPDSQLEPEIAWGGEGSVTITRGRLTARGVLFATWLGGAIYSRTLPRLPQDTVTTRIRSNGDGRALGAEIEIDARVRDWLSGWVSVTAGNSEFTGGQLEGNKLPQVPPAQAAAGARVTRGRWLASLEARYWGRQFDDDRNTFELKSGASANALGAVRFARAHVFASIENIFDAEIDAGRTPLRTLAQPRVWQVGVRIFTK
jgi:outer membrane receptor protein involved in Fe transport